MYQDACWCILVAMKRTVIATAALAAVFVVAGCDSSAPTPDPIAQLIGHVHVASINDFNVTGYAQAICKDLGKIPAPTSHNLGLLAIQVSNDAPATLDDADAVANGAVTYICPQYKALHVPVA